MLYYGDEKLDPPVYDYAKLFLLAKDAGPAQVGGNKPMRLIREGRMSASGQRSTRQSCG